MINSTRASGRWDTHSPSIGWMSWFRAEQTDRAVLRLTTMILHWPPIGRHRGRWLSMWLSAPPAFFCKQGRRFFAGLSSYNINLHTTISYIDLKQLKPHWYFPIESMNALLFNSERYMHHEHTSQCTDGPHLSGLVHNCVHQSLCQQ